MSASPKSSGVLLIEDTPSLQMLYRSVLNRAGFAPICVSNCDEARQAFAQARPSVVLLDMILPDGDGLGLMREFLTVAPDTRVIVITANGTVNKAVEATRKGAYDFLVKPLGDVRLASTVASALAEIRAKAQRQRRDPAAETDSFVARSAVMRDVQSVLAAVARSHAPVFLLGQSGTGKKACAYWIHMHSARAEGPFVMVDCGIPDCNALEATLFGGGSGPELSEDSAIRRAMGGTLLLLSPQNLPAELQTRLVAVFDKDHAVDRQQDPVSWGVRVISAARQDPRHALQNAQLQAELYYRLFVLPVALPRLSERREDVPALAQRFLVEIAQQENKTFNRITPEAQAHLQIQPWDGNLHELRNSLRHAVVLNDGPELTRQMLPITQSDPQEFGTGAGRAVLDLDTALAGMTMAQIETRALRAAIARHHGSITQAAKELDIAPSTIYRRREDWSDLTS